MLYASRWLRVLTLSLGNLLKSVTCINHVYLHYFCSNFNFIFLNASCHFCIKTNCIGDKIVVTATCIHVSASRTLSTAPRAWNSLSSDVKSADTVKTTSSTQIFQTLPGLKDFSYEERLKFLGWPTLELRRLHTDLIWCYKILFGLVNLNTEDFFPAQYKPD